ncbi:MAG: hypothetical protein AAGF06_02275 [Pseudomonadota bacterium]
MNLSNYLLPKDQQEYLTSLRQHSLISLPALTLFVVAWIVYGVSMYSGVTGQWPVWLGVGVAGFWAKVVASNALNVCRFDLI